MKKGWEYKTLGEVCKLYQPKTISTKEMVPCGEYNVFGANGIIGKYNKYNHEDSEILMTCRGATCGNINISTPKSWINGNAMVIHINNKSQLFQKFVVYALTIVDKSQVITGSAQPQITRQKLFPLIIPIPPLSEQKEIVSRLDKAFEQIETLRRNAEQSLTTAQQLFQSTLSHLLTPQPHWDRKTLRELCEKSVNIKWDEVSQEKTFVYIDLTAVNRETKRIEQTQQIDSINAPSRAKQIVTRGDVLFATTRPTLRRVCIVPDVFNGQICSTGFCVLRPKKDLLSEYLLFKLQEDDFYKYIEPLQTGANYPAVTDSIVKRYSIYVPPLTEQTAIVAKLDSLSAKVKQLKDNYTRTVALCDEMKQALLKEVFED